MKDYKLIVVEPYLTSSFKVDENTTIEEMRDMCKPFKNIVRLYLSIHDSELKKSYVEYLDHVSLKS